jgi:hypothetical protein
MLAQLGGAGGGRICQPRLAYAEPFQDRDIERRCRHLQTTHLDRTVGRCSHDRRPRADRRRRHPPWLRLLPCCRAVRGDRCACRARCCAYVRSLPAVARGRAIAPPVGVPPTVQSNGYHPNARRVASPSNWPSEATPDLHGILTAPIALPHVVASLLRTNLVEMPDSACFALRSRTYLIQATAAPPGSRRRSTTAHAIGLKENVTS